MRSFFEQKSWWKYDVCWLLKSSCFEPFGDGKYGLSLSQKVDGKTFADYWKVLVLNFSEMGNTVFFWATKLMERWFLLITEKFLLWTFWWWKIRILWAKKLMKRLYLLGVIELSMIFHDLGNRFFMQWLFFQIIVLQTYATINWDQYLWNIQCQLG